MFSRPAVGKYAELQYETLGGSLIWNWELAWKLDMLGIISMGSGTKIGHKHCPTLNEKEQNNG